MSTQVVVLGAGYAGAGTLQRLEEELDDDDAELTLISEHNYHLVLHEAHRAIRNPAVESKIAIPIDEITAPSTRFVKGRAERVDVEDRTVELEGGDSVDYDYLAVCVGTATAFYGIEGLREHSLTLKSLDDAREIHQSITEAAQSASEDDPAHVVVGGAGLSGIQASGEIAALRDERDVPIEVSLVEGLDNVFPGNDPELQGALRKRLEASGVDILTGDFISEVDDETIYVGGGEDTDPEELDYDVLLWTGGITGQDAVANTDVEQDERSHRVFAESDFTTSDERVFALGDTALVDQGEGNDAPPTAQAAWQAAEVAGQNVARAIRGQPLRTWKHHDRGTVVSVGDEAVAHDVENVPVNTFGGRGAEILKKGIAAKWIADVSSLRRAVDAWNDM